MEYLIYPLIYVLVIVGIIVFVVKMANRKKQGDPPLDWRRFGVGAAISVILPCFISFSTSAVFNELTNTTSFIAMIGLAVIFLIVGLVLAHHTVISTSLIIGAVIEIIVAFGYNMDSIPPAVMAIVAGLGLAILIYFAYRKMQEQEVR